MGLQGTPLACFVVVFHCFFKGFHGFATWDPPRVTQDSPRAPKMLPRAPKTSPKAPNMSPRPPQDLKKRPKTLKNPPQSAPRAPKTTPSTPSTPSIALVALLLPPATIRTNILSAAATATAAIAPRTVPNQCYLQSSSSLLPRLFFKGRMTAPAQLPQAPQRPSEKPPGSRGQPGKSD